MTDRTREILFSSVHQFIAAGLPITSERLYESGDFGIKPAMIRWELQELADTGYLYQTHPSGGRLPTDKAYRFFVRELKSRGDADFAPRHTPAFLGEFPGGDRQSFVDEIAGYLELLGVGYETDRGTVYESGLCALLEHLELPGKRDLLEVIRDFEELPERIAAHQELWEVVDEWPQVFIGESPLTTSEHLALIAGRFRHPAGDFLFVAVGPKRMDYRKSLALFRALERIVASSE